MDEFVNWFIWVIFVSVPRDDGGALRVRIGGFCAHLGKDTC